MNTELHYKIHILSVVSDFQLWGGGGWWKRGHTALAIAWHCYSNCPSILLLYNIIILLGDFISSVCHVHVPLVPVYLVAGREGEEIGGSYA